MAKPQNIGSTAHAQQAEMALIVGVKPQPADTALAEAQSTLADERAAHAATTGQLTEANAQVEALTAELAAEKEAHAKAQAALNAAIGNVA